MSPVEINLEVWKIIVSALTPAAIAFAGLYINKAIKTREHKLAVLRRKQDIRKEIYDEIGPKLNQIFCFVCDVGDFGYYEPQHITDSRLQTNTKFKTYKKLWDDKTARVYDQFMELCFDINSGGVGTPAKIRATTYEKEVFFSRVGKEWKPEWNKMFTDPAYKDAVFKAYDSLVEAFINDITSDKVP
jgi:hypothetical protein